MKLKRDSLGRRIPRFDRSAAAKKGRQTYKERHGTLFQSLGGKASGRGYFGKLKAEDPALLAKISAEGVASRKLKQTGDSIHHDTTKNTASKKRQGL